MDIYVFVLKRYHHRTGEIIGKSVGFVKEESLEKAEKAIEEKYVGDDCTVEFIEEIKDNSYMHTVYRSSM